MTSRFMRRKDAAEYLKARYGFGAKATLAKLAVVGGGPEFSYAGSRLPVYEEKALDDWARSKISKPVLSTSDRDPEGSDQ